MTDARRKPFQSIAADVDDHAIEEIARAKGVPVMMPTREPGKVQSIGAGEGAHDPVPDPETMATPRSRMSYVKTCIPDYALMELKMRAARDNVTIGHILLKALHDSGIFIKDADLIDDGRRSRGKSAHGV